MLLGVIMGSKVYYQVNLLKYSLQNSLAYFLGAYLVYIEVNFEFISFAINQQTSIDLCSMSNNINICY